MKFLNWKNPIKKLKIYDLFFINSYSNHYGICDSTDYMNIIVKEDK